MAYKKPQLVAKSVAKKSYVAGCPTNTNPFAEGCSDSSIYAGSSCEIRRSN